MATATSTSGAAPLAVQFTGSGSTDSDGNIVSYAWTFGDGGTASVANPAHTYSTQGTYNAVLTVTDNQGATGTATVQIQVGDCISLPNAAAYGRITGGDQTHVDKVTYCFQGVAGDMILTYQVYDIDTNGEAVVRLNGQKVFDVQSGPNNGWSTNRTATLPDALVLNGASNTLEFDNPSNPPNTLLWGVRQVSVSPAQGGNQPPNAVATANPTSGTAPLTVQFNGAGSTDGDGFIASYAWTFGDGGATSIANPQQTYNVAGIYNARLIVTDNQGAKDTAFVQIQVQVAGNQAPKAVATANPTSGTAPLSVQFAGSGSTDSDGTIVSYAWIFGDGGTASVANPQRTYSAPGTYNAVLTVTDNLGAKGTASISITVNSAGGTALRVNCGGSQYTATNGKIFRADQMYTPGGWGFADTSSNDVYKTTAAISGTSDPTLYQAQRTKVDLTYLFDLPNGTYDVILHFAELQDNEAGRRVMDISAEGNLVLNDFDVWVAAGGRNIAIKRLISGVTVNDGQLTLNFIRSVSTVKRRPAIAAIEVGPAGTLAKPEVAERSEEAAATSSLPEGYALEQNYPNPFNPSTNISFVLPEAGEVRLMIYNSVGQPVRKPLVRYYQAGRNTIRINASNWASGVYFYEIQVNGFRAIRKMILSR
jgi:PKD repeat protein